MLRFPFAPPPRPFCHSSTVRTRKPTIAIINGRRVNVNNIPNGGVYGRQLIEEAGFGNKRRPVMQRGGFNFETVDANRRYSRNDLVDKNG